MAKEVDDDQIHGTHCPNGLKFGTLVHHGMGYNVKLGGTNFDKKKWVTLQFL